MRSSRLLLVGRVDLEGHLTDHREEVALDPGLDAGTGDLVLVAKEGAVVADLFDADNADTEQPTPANVVIVAIVEGWTAPP